MTTPKRRHATLQDVADLAGVSRMSVSRVLSGKQNTSPELAKRVHDAIAKTGFRINRAASNLRQGRILTTIGMVVDQLADPHFALVAEAVREVAEENDAVLVVTSGADNPAGEAELVEALLERNVDGLLLYPTADRQLPELRVGFERPLVLLGRSSGDDAADAVLTDNIGGAHTATTHLIQHGHRRIGVVAFGSDDGNDIARPDIDTLAGRLEGYRRALGEHGIPYDPTVVVFGGTSTEMARRATQSLLGMDDPPTAIFALNNRMAVGALLALGSGLRDLAFISIDDFELSEVFDPPISVITKDPREMGRQAAEILFERLAGGSFPPRRIMQPMTLIPRGSGERPPR